MSDNTSKKTGRGLARAMRRLKESAKAGKLQQVPTQREAVQKLISPRGEKLVNAA
jgi:hypothetical protein